MRQPNRLVLLILTLVFLVVFFPTSLPELKGVFRFLPFCAIVFIGFFAFGFELIQQIIIGRDGIYFIGLFRKRYIPWEKVKSSGVLRITKYSKEELLRVNYSRSYWSGIKITYVTVIKRYTPTTIDMLLNSADVITFDYRKEAQELVEYYILKNHPH